MPRIAIPLDEARRRRLMTALECGATIRLAAQAAGVSEDTLSRWRKADPALQTAMDESAARGAVQALETIRAAAAAGTWQAAAWMLERRYPADYARRSPPEEPDQREREHDAETEAKLAKALELLERGEKARAFKELNPQWVDRADCADQ